MKVVIGLGNPGPRYAGTRHNLGYLVADGLERDLGLKPVGLDIPGRVSRGIVRTPEGEEVVLLVRPTTWMNNSGRAVRALPGFRPAAPDGPPAETTGEEISPADLFVIVDDVYLPFGRLRLRGGGSAGGHNGLQSVLEAAGTTAVPRLRCGVGPAPVDVDLVDYVLEDLTVSEKELLTEFVDRAALAARTYLEEGLSAAMNRFNQNEGA